MARKLLWLLLLLAVAALFALWCSNADNVLAVCREWAMRYKLFIRDHETACWLGMLAAGSLAINSPVPLAALIKLLSGYIFGIQGGFLLNVGMSVLGGFLGFAASRYLFYQAFHAHFSRPLAKVSLEIARNGFWYVLSSRLFMVAPFFLVNVLAGLSGIRKRKFLLGTALGVLPSSMIYALSGDKLESIRSLSDLADPRVTLALAGLAVVAVLPAVIGRRSGSGKPR